MVIGWENETTLQYEGIAEELTGPFAEKFKEIYYRDFPDGKERAKTRPGLVHFKVSPVWVRYSNYNQPNVIKEINL